MISCAHASLPTYPPAFQIDQTGRTRHTSCIQCNADTYKHRDKHLGQSAPCDQMGFWEHMYCHQLPSDSSTRPAFPCATRGLQLMWTADVDRPRQQLAPCQLTLKLSRQRCGDASISALSCPSSRSAPVRTCVLSHLYTWGALRPFPLSRTTYGFYRHSGHRMPSLCLSMQVTSAL